jgi:hypothetical protein
MTLTINANTFVICCKENDNASKKTLLVFDEIKIDPWHFEFPIIIVLCFMRTCVFVCGG